MFLIGARTGKKKAHDILYRAAMEAREERKSFIETVAAQEEIAGRFTIEELRRATDPEIHMGHALEITSRVIEKSENLRKNDTAIANAPSPCPLAGPDGKCGLEKQEGSR